MVRHGLHIVAKTRKGGKRWYVYAYRGGPCIHVQDGAKPVVTRELMIAAEAAKVPLCTADSIDALIADYEANPDFIRLSVSTKRDYRLWLNRISQRFGKCPVEAFEDRRMRGDIIAWRNLWASQPRSADKASVMMATLLSWAVENGRLAINVAAGIKTLHRANRADLIWEERHWQAVAGIPVHVMNALKLAHLTGLRLGDLVRLDWSQVGPHAIIVERTRKTGGRAVIPIQPELRSLIDTLSIERQGPVLRNTRGQAWTESGLETVWQRRKPKGFDRRIHDLRGTFATWLAVKGFTDDEIARVLGWTSKRIAALRARYVDEARVVVSMAERAKA